METCAKQCQNQGCQTDISFQNYDDKLSESWLMAGASDKDEWQPSDKSFTDTSIEEESCNTTCSPHKEKKYLVFERQLE